MTGVFGTHKGGSVGICKVDSTFANATQSSNINQCAFKRVADNRFMLLHNNPGGSGLRASVVDVDPETGILTANINQTISTTLTTDALSAFDRLEDDKVIMVYSNKARVATINASRTLTLGTEVTMADTNPWVVARDATNAVIFVGNGTEDFYLPTISGTTITLGSIGNSGVLGAHDTTDTQVLKMDSDHILFTNDNYNGNTQGYASILKISGSTITEHDGTSIGISGVNTVFPIELSTNHYVIIGKTGGRVFNTTVGASPTITLVGSGFTIDSPGDTGAGAKVNASRIVVHEGGSPFRMKTFDENGAATDFTLDETLEYDQFLGSFNYVQVNASATHAVTYRRMNSSSQFAHVFESFKL